MNAPLPPGLLLPPQVEARRARPLLGTLVEIAATGPSAEEVNEAINRAFDAVEMVHALMSYHDPDSEISRINRGAFQQPQPVHAHTWRVLTAARDMAETSGGLFDITIAPALTRMGYLPRHPGFPRASGQGDWRHVEFLPGNQVRLARRLRVDLGGIAKGYAVDLAVRALENSGMATGRVNAGGDLRVFGDEAQVIHVRHPIHASRMLPLLRIQRGAVATSAGYFSARLQRGRWITPLIHPATRSSCDAGRSVSVLAEDCMTADALTKIVHADPARSPGILEKFNARAVVLEQDAVSRCCRMLHNEHGRWQVQLLPNSDHD